MSFLFTGASGMAGRPLSSRMFSLPSLDGRRILYVVSFLQRIGKTASVGVWLSEACRRIQQDRGDSPQVEWAAVRQFELFQEAGNLAIWDLDVIDIGKAFKDLMKMRSSGYRVTVVTLGDYVGSSGDYDELRIMDSLLQEEISRLVNMMYLEELSLAATDGCRQALETGSWKCVDALPHISMIVGANRLFAAEGKSAAKSEFAGKLLEAVEKLPQGKVLHDVAFGLALPEASKERIWTYIADPENRHLAFTVALRTVFEQFGCVSLDALNGRDVPTMPDGPAAMSHLRGYGDMIRPEHHNDYREMAMAARQ